MSIQIQLRRGTSTEWASANPSPILAAAEMGVETDTDKIKLGNGFDNWNTLPYIVGGAGGAGSTGPTGPAGGGAGGTGSTGATGATGPAGTNGSNGATGPAGTNGSNGATGPAGTNGSNGADSTVTGPTGATGPINIGYTGIVKAISGSYAITNLDNQTVLEAANGTVISLGSLTSAVKIDIVQTGTGTVTITGSNLNSRVGSGTVYLSAQYAGCTVYNNSSGAMANWIVVGDISSS